MNNSLCNFHKLVPCTLVFVFVSVSEFLLLSWSKVFVFHLLLRDLELGQDRSDVSKEARWSAEVEVVGGRGFGDDLLDALFGDAI